jgi:hypothetical protein
VSSVAEFVNGLVNFAFLNKLRSQGSFDNYSILRRIGKVSKEYGKPRQLSWLKAPVENPPSRGGGGPAWDRLVAHVRLARDQLVIDEM